MFFVEVKGEYACFTDCLCKVERVSYPVITPSAARGILESVLWHPGMAWHIRRIYVMKPIQYTNIKRNEVKTKLLGSSVRAVMGGDIKMLHIATTNEIQQRASMILRDVHYIIQAEFSMTTQANASDNPGKFTDMFKRRLRRGACYHQGYLGCREFPAQISLYEAAVESIKPAAALEGRDDLGYMLYDMDYSDRNNIKPVFYRAVMQDGVIEVPEWEVVKNASTVVS